jgi:hypothetical protein
MHFRPARGSGLASILGSLSTLNVAFVCFFCLIASSAPWAQPGPVKCAQVLTAEQVRAAVGAALEVVAQKKPEVGVSECNWSRAGAAAASGANIRLQFFERAAISANPVVHTPDGYYDMIASAAEEIAGRKRDAVAGVTGRAATVQGSTQTLLVVQRPDGVARVVLGNMTKAQVAAIARAISNSP